MARARSVGVEREHFTPAIDDGELVNQPFELGNQVGGDQNGPASGIAILVRPDHGSNELSSDDRVESRGRLVEDQQFGFGTDASDERELRVLAFGGPVVFWRRIEAKAASRKVRSRLNIPACGRNDAKYPRTSRTFIHG